MVSQALRLTRLDVFHDLSHRLAGESVGGYFGDCLDALLGATSAKSAIAFALDDRLELVADRGLDTSHRPLSALLRGASTFAERCLATRKPSKSSDLRTDRDGVDDAAERIEKILRRQSRAIGPFESGAEVKRVDQPVTRDLPALRGGQVSRDSYTKGLEYLPYVVDRVTSGLSCRILPAMF